MTKEERIIKQKEKWNEMRSHEIELHNKGFKSIAGIDEVGRGPLAGPVVAACVILPLDCEILGIDDSKKLSDKKRREIVEEIKEKAIAIGIGSATNVEIDDINILNATKLAMKRAVDKVQNKIDIDILLIDAIRLNDVDISQESIIKGDEKSATIAAASIVAKVARDDYMIKMENLFSGYNFASNKGYGTKAHYEGISKIGISPIHRKTFLKTLNKNIDKIKKNEKFYAVKKGRQIGIYKSWDDCKKEVDGFKGAEFKSFSSLDDAKAYLSEKDNYQKGYIAYVDGSYDDKNKTYSGGVVIIKDGKIIKQISEKYDDEGDSKLRNVAGEIAGARLAIDFAIENNFNKITIYHDYMGIGKWACDEWKANLPLTKDYKEFIKESRKKLEIKFVKVKGHSGNKYNEMADKLARDVLK